MFSLRYRYLFILLLGIYSYLNLLFTGGKDLFEFETPQLVLLCLMLFIVFGVWELNRIAEKLINRFPSKAERVIHPLLLLFIISLLNVALVSIGSLQVLYLILNIPVHLDYSNLKLLILQSLRVNLFLNCLNAIVYYMNRVKQVELEAEQLKKNSVEAQFEVLRNQINPHFLFNSFNVLSTLVYRDADMSAKFISQLSNVYRYLLFNQQGKLVSLKDELAFIDSYLYLLKIRFGNNIQIEKNINVLPTRYYVPPGVIQMLIENAIKHNVVSRKNPLQIVIQTEKEYLTVENVLQPKKVAEQASTHVGLNNIISRYGLLSNKQVEVKKSETRFVVKIPLVE